MRILVTGCSGVLGRNLIEYLSSYDKFEITGVDICDFGHHLIANFKFEKASFLDLEIAKNICLNTDVIVHCGSAAPSYPDDEIHNIVVHGTQQLLEQAVEHNVSRFIYISSTAVYGIPDHAPVTENSEIQPFHDAYNQSKIEAEKICLSFRDKGIVVPILRPRTFIGPGRMGTIAILNEWAMEG